MTKLLSIDAAADLLSVSKWSVRAWIRTGKLRPVRLGRRVLLEESELERLIAENQSPLIPSGGTGATTEETAG